MRRSGSPSSYPSPVMGLLVRAPSCRSMARSSRVAHRSATKQAHYELRRSPLRLWMPGGSVATRSSNHDPGGALMASANPYLNFAGNCMEAFDFYRSVFGGEYTNVSKFSDMPSEATPDVSHE